MIDFGSEVEASRRANGWKFSLGSRVIIDKTCRDCESMISGVILMVGSHVQVIACVCVRNFGTKFFKGGRM